MNRMPVVIAGAGALGTCYGSLLARAGADVCLLVRPERAAGFPRVARCSGLVEAEGPVRIATSGREVGPSDYVFVTTKTADTATVLAALEGIDAEAVLSLQNGLGKNEALAGAFGRERVLGAACVVGADLVALGHARVTMNQATWIGELDGGSSARVARLVAVLRAAGFPSWSVPNIVGVEWYKVCALLPGALVTALSRRTYAEMALHPHLARLFVRIMRETYAVPRALGYEIADPPGSPWQTAAWLRGSEDEALAGLRAIGERQQAAGQPVLPSMLQDVLAGRKTEVEDTAGDLIRRAHAAGVDLPATETCYRLLRGLEDGFGD